MKLKNKLLIIISALFILPSCTEYLDVVPDNVLTLEDLFAKKDDAWNALAKVYHYMPSIDETHNSSWLLGDEWLGRLDQNDNSGSLHGARIMRGLQSVSSPQLGLWSGGNGSKDMYEGIRQANVFLGLIDNVPDMTEKEKMNWSAQVKFLKAYYHFLLIRRYGPIVIADKQIAADALSDELFQKRTKVDSCFNYVIKLMKEAIPDLQERVTTILLGQVDQVAAKGILARVMVYRASPFFNGNKEYFGDFLDSDGEPFFPMTYDKEKWKDAVDAVDDALAACSEHGVSLYRYEGAPFVFDEDDYKENKENLQKLYDLRMCIVDPWNKEVVWGYSNINVYGQGDWASSTNMRLPEGYGDGVTNTATYSWQWMGASYSMAERFYTNNGVPIDQDLTYDLENKYKVITTPGSEDPEYKDLKGIMQPGSETVELYMNREPRFYADLGITGGYWRTHGVRINTMMYYGEDGGYNSYVTTDYYETGIACKKFVYPESKSGAWQRTIKYPFPIMRLADLYLLKAEALNEYLDAPTQEVYDAVDSVRIRAGIPKIQTVWADATIVRDVNKHTTKEGMRDIILEERSIELSFEGQHFWDMLLFKKASSEFSSPVYGWNYKGTTGADFFVPEVKQSRKFTITDCLTPIDLNEMNTNSKLIQNPGW